jgi:large subunit ribosomal protein L29
MKAKDLREMTTDQLQTRLNNAREEMMKLRFQQATGELTDHTRLRKIRRDVARYMTVLAERMKAEKEGEE